MFEARRMESRLAIPADAPEVVRLASVMYASMGVATPANWWDHAVEAFSRRLSQEGEEVVAFVIDRPGGDGGLAASGVGVTGSRLPSPNNPTGRVGYIQWVATDTTYRRQGMARAVMVGLLSWFDQGQVPVVELHATADGEPLYRSLGFGQEGGVALRRRARDES